MNSLISKPTPTSIVSARPLLLLGAILISGCSGSSGPETVNADSENSANSEIGSTDIDTTSTGGATDQIQNDSSNGDGSPDSEVQGSTQVTFNITVPAYVSDALQVRLVWGDIARNAAWVVDESWTVAENFPTDTEHRLTITFSDDNGATTLGSFETDYKTGINSSESFQVSADQFDTSSWDDDADGISNLEERKSDSDNTHSDPPTEPTDPLLPVQASVELVTDKTFRIMWEPTAAADYYTVLENPDGVSGYTAISDQLDSSTDHFDHRVSLPKRVNARYMVEACNATECTLSVQQLMESTLDQAIGYFKASNTETRDHFGNSVSLSEDGTTMAVSALDEDSSASGVNGNQSDNSLTDSGAVYVFVRSDGSWQQQAYLKASNPKSNVDFGVDISLSADGNTLAVGALREDGNATGVNGIQNEITNLNAGAVYVYNRNGSAWQQQAYIKASNTRPEARSCCDHRVGDFFGQKLSLSDDGNTLAVAAPGEFSGDIGIDGDLNDDPNFRTGSGAVYLFSRTGTNWQQQAHFKAPTVVSSSSRDFGRSLSISGDGNTVAAGTYDTASVPVIVSSAPANSTGIAPLGASFSASYYYGAAHVYSRADGNWTHQALLINITGSPTSYGWSIALNGDGSTLAVAAPKGIDIHKRSNGVWQGQSYLESFNQSIDLSADGNTLVAGFSGEDSGSTGVEGYRGTEQGKGNSGAAFVFEQRNSTWQQSIYLKASNTGSSNYFGIDVAISADGDTVAVGATGESGTSTGFNGSQIQAGSDSWGSGAAYIY